MSAVTLAKMEQKEKLKELGMEEEGMLNNNRKSRRRKTWAASSKENKDIRLAKDVDYKENKLSARSRSWSSPRGEKSQLKTSSVTEKTLYKSHFAPIYTCQSF